MDRLTLLLLPYGSGPSPAGSTPLHQMPHPHRLCRSSAEGMLHLMPPGMQWHSHYGYHSHWQDDVFGHRNRSYEGPRDSHRYPPMHSLYARWICKRRSSNTEETTSGTRWPELLVEWGSMAGNDQLVVAVGNLTLVVFYFLILVGQCTCKSICNVTKQMVQFKMEDITFL